MYCMAASDDMCYLQDEPISLFVERPKGGPDCKDSVPI